MNEAQEVHTESSEAGAWLTVAEAARRLGITPRSVQRRCTAGKLRARLITNASGQAWKIDPAGMPDAKDASDTNDATLTTKKAPNDTLTTLNGATVATLTTDDDVSPATLRTLPTQPNDTGDDVTARYVAHLEAEVTHLRGQIEAHARAEAELRAALREALKISAKALPSPEVTPNQQASDGTVTPFSERVTPNQEAVTPLNQGVTPTQEPVTPQARDATRRDESSDTAPQIEHETTVATQTTQPIEPRHNEPLLAASAATEGATTWYPPREQDSIWRRFKVWLVGG